MTAAARLSETYRLDCSFMARPLAFFWLNAKQGDAGLYCRVLSLFPIVTEALRL